MEDKLEKPQQEWKKGVFNSKPFTGVLVPSSLQVRYSYLELGNLFKIVSSNVPNLGVFCLLIQNPNPVRLPSEYFKDYITEEFYVQAAQFTNCLLYTSRCV